MGRSAIWLEVRSPFGFHLLRWPKGVEVDNARQRIASMERVGVFRYPSAQVCGVPGARKRVHARDHNAEMGWNVAVLC